MRILYRRTACICSFKGNNSPYAMREIKMNVSKLYPLTVFPVKSTRLRHANCLWLSSYQEIYLDCSWYSNPIGTWGTGNRTQNKNIPTLPCSKYGYTPYALRVNSLFLYKDKSYHFSRFKLRCSKKGIESPINVILVILAFICWFWR